VPLYGPEFAADPQAYYSYLRGYGATAPVELAPGVEAALVTDYQAALRLLQDPSFREDARRWRAFNEGTLPADSPVVPVLAYRPKAMFSDGAEHLRLRQTITDAMMRVHAHRVARSTKLDNSRSTRACPREVTQVSAITKFGSVADLVIGGAGRRHLSSCPWCTSRAFETLLPHLSGVVVELVAWITHPGWHGTTYSMSRDRQWVRPCARSLSAGVSLIRQLSM
jgi:hypothetical protein